DSQPKRNPSKMTGFVHHALAFNTLLSSQETDAYTVPKKFFPRRRWRNLALRHPIRRPDFRSNPLTSSSDQILAALGTYRVILRLSNQPIIR
ncbi:hypothetical protein, partial [Nonomuraea sp. NPDC048826]|uniref:hypothetical protein n=1 Tax=Nonomuraea sp. NPDC048826 TaxID=3364347 RepID=UPI0037103B6C